MREILFRGKRLHDNKWIYGNFVSDCEGNPHIIEPRFFCEDGHHLQYEDNTDTPVFIIPETVGQYTGLDVANGNVFDGDYLKFGAYILEVFWNGETFQWQAGKVGRSYDRPFRCCGNYRGDKWTVIDLGEIAAEPIITGQMTTEIVGNRWDNPELLPQKSKCEWDLF